jgi:hypothetical protein
LRRRSLRAYLIFQRALLDKLDRGILHRIVRNGSARHQTLQCLGRNVHDRTVFTACRNVHVRNLAGQQFAINQDEVFQRQFIGKLRRAGKGYFHFQPALALVGLELLVLIFSNSKSTAPRGCAIAIATLAETMIALIKIVRFI